MFSVEARHLLDGMAQWSLEADTASFNALCVGCEGSVLVRASESWGREERKKQGNCFTVFFFVNCWSQNDSEKDWVSEHRCGFLGTNVD